MAKERASPCSTVSRSCFTVKPALSRPLWSSTHRADRCTPGFSQSKRPLVGEASRYTDKVFIPGNRWRVCHRLQTVLTCQVCIASRDFPTPLPSPPLPVPQPIKSPQGSHLCADKCRSIAIKSNIAFFLSLCFLNLFVHRESCSFSRLAWRDLDLWWEVEGQAAWFQLTALLSKYSPSYLRRPRRASVSLPIHTTAVSSHCVKPCSALILMRLRDVIRLITASLATSSLSAWLRLRAETSSHLIFTHWHSHFTLTHITDPWRPGV